MAKHKQPPTSTLHDALAALPRYPLVAVSGGIDSLSLLHACHTVGLQPRAAHYNHRWHPRETRWTRHIKEWCAAHDIPCHTSAAKKAGFTSETHARELRYRYLLRLAKKLQSPALLTAHHADDQAETLLLRLLRGTGPDGLGGIPASSQRQSITILRPWLTCTRRQIGAYAGQYNIPAIDDPYNHSPDCLRSRVRHELLPQLQQLAMPGLSERLALLAEILSDDATLLHDLALAALPSLLDRTHPHRLHCRALAQQHPALRRRILRAWLQQTISESLSTDLIEKIHRLALTTTKPSRLNLPGGRVLTRRAARLEIL